jgi:MYXO-CTERM domain-containing protein
MAESAAMLIPRLALGLALAGCAADADEPPSPPGEAAAGLAVLALGERGAIGPVAVTPLRVEEDSRCPAGVQCIQAGTVRVAVRIEQGGTRLGALLTLAEPFPLDGGRRLMLAAACPYPRHPGTIGAAAYRFTFALVRDGAAPPAVSTCTS